MNSFGNADLVKRFEKRPRKGLALLSPLAKLDELFSEDTQEPENYQENIYEPNDYYIEPKELKKKTSEQKQVILAGKFEEKKEEERKKNYRPGPFAKFYQLSEGALDKDREVWFYKEHKDIIGPVSSYNMDKLVYYKQVNDDTKVAFLTVEKFKKFGKIRKIADEEGKV